VSGLLERILAWPQVQQSEQIEAFPVETLTPEGADKAMLGASKYQRRDGDFYATPEWVTEVLCRHVKFDAVWEPACGEGHMSRVLERNGAFVWSTDLFDRGYGQEHGRSFLDTTLPRPDDTSMNLDIVTNPPYSLADEFVEHAIDLARPRGRRVAMLCRNEWDCSGTIRPHLFGGNPYFALKIVLTKRPRWIEGSTGNPRHNYAWYVWDFSRRQVPTIIYDQ
jgi:hypothetical protein